MLRNSHSSQLSPAQSHDRLGKALAQQKRWSEAIAAYRQALAIDPQLWTAYRNLAEALEQQGQLEEASEFWYQAFQRAPEQATPAQHLTLGNRLWQQGKSDAAMECYRTAIASNPKLVVAYHNLGEALSQQGRWEEAIACYQRVLEIEPNTAQTHHGLGDLFGKQQQWQEAAAAYRKAIELNPAFSWSYNNLGDALRHQQQWQEAAVAYRKAIELNPAFAWSPYNLADVLAKQGEWEEAIGLYRHAMQQQPDLPQVQSKLAYALYNHGLAQLDAAIACYREAMAANPYDVELYYKALEVKPRNAIWYFQLGKAFERKGELAQAIVFYNIAIQIDPSQYEEALAAYSRIMQSDPSSPLVVGKLSESYASIGKLCWQQAIACQERAEQLNPDNTQAEYPDFDCKAYLELNPDLQSAIATEAEALQHFLIHGLKEGRLYSFEQLYYKPRPARSQPEAKSVPVRQPDSIPALSSGFDWQFYLEYNNDLEELLTYEQAYQHWENHGREEGRIASESQFYAAHGSLTSDLPSDFDWQHYLDLHLDLATNIKSKWKAIGHYLTIGKKEKRIYCLEELHRGSQVAARSPMPDLSQPVCTSVQRLAVFFHLYYFDLWDEVRSYLQNIEEAFDFYVNIVESIWEPQMVDRIRRDFPHARIIVSPNRGKDIGGQLASMEQVDFSHYDVFCLIHTKKSPHISSLISDQWRRDLYDAILGTPEKVKRNLEILRKDPSVGLIGSRFWRNTEVLHNAEHYYRLLDMFEIKPEARACEYVSGTMMLVRQQIWQAVFDRFRNQDLEDGNGKDILFQKDGQIAHALERMIGNLVQHFGMRFFWQE
jgi:tetratricopeptide (TPR) repeat protein